MPRFHKIWQEVRTQFTPEEETRRDAEEVLAETRRAANLARETRRKELTQKLADGTITLDIELLELLRLERGL